MEFLTISQAIHRFVAAGDCVALEGFAHLIPFAAGHEIIRQRIGELTLVRLTPDVIYDQLIGMGLAKKLVFSWCGNPGVGSLHRIREAIECGWPRELELDERSHAAMVAAYSAGAARIPMSVVRGYSGSNLLDHNRQLRTITCPFTGQELWAVRAVNPDVTVIHAQRADRQGNVHIQGITGVQKEIVMAADRVIVTVEEIVDQLDVDANAYVLPHWTIDAVSEVRGGAYPSYAQGYYERDNAFYVRWDSISRSRDWFAAWMHEYVLETVNHAEFLQRLHERREFMPS